ncbi:LysR family transcriptional regulator [Sphingosinithalassobacter portus]|uniref:LysR family transcriptional regulator n=1 Tax=Stakelama portus TaxID=2676234 RepID=UPI000D6DC75D|nr:LysR family transcriptional regulator [Sphingosinithalassobacter portus]
MNWDDLRIFLAVARAQRFATAGRLLGVDPTTVSRRLARLSDRVGAPLFESIGSERHLSEAGRALLTHAEAIEAAVLAATEQPGEAAAAAGHVRLSVAEGLATSVLAPAMPEFAERHPAIRLDLITASGFLSPSKREADIAVMLARPRGAQLRASELRRYRLRLYGAATYLDRHGAPQSVAALREHRLVSYVPEHIYAPELDYITEVHPDLAPRLRSTSINVQRMMVAAGAGLGILPDFMAATLPDLHPVLAEQVEVWRTFWLVTHPDTHHARRIQAVCDWLSDVTSVG